ncbi:MAG TPA: Holliday junction branch migration protein RuvA [Clostridia bacterium]|nr:MAG: Holliday junction ATP-dependent DNA helicase RuvA [Firmicutes bacterium ADurb.Bin356]HOF94412.1 Holliday junction branch migration protein RuvA [Clostridia bacterium]
MYAHIRGEVIEIAAERAVIEAYGVGYELLCSSKTLSALKKGKEAMLFAHLHTAEGLQALYGFIDEAERTMFRRLITVTRVGPKLALSVLSTLTPSEAAEAIITENAASLERVPGLGKKTAQRLLLELKEKVGEYATIAGAAGDIPMDVRTQAVSALIGLGYDAASATKAVMAVKTQASIEELITLALRTLAKT